MNLNLPAYISPDAWDTAHKPSSEKKLWDDEMVKECIGKDTVIYGQGVHWIQTNKNTMSAKWNRQKCTQGIFVLVFFAISIFFLALKICFWRLITKNTKTKNVLSVVFFFCYF